MSFSNSSTFSCFGNAWYSERYSWCSIFLRTRLLTTDSSQKFKGRLFAAACGIHATTRLLFSSWNDLAIKLVTKNLAITENVYFMPLENLVYIFMLFEVLINKFNISSIDLSFSLSTIKASSKLQILRVHWNQVSNVSLTFIWEFVE